MAMPGNILLLLSRFLVAALFIPAGFSTLGNISGSASYFASLGFPMSTLVAWGTGLFEMTAGAAILAGLQTRAAAVVLALFSLAAGFIGHYGQGGGDATLTFLHSQMLMKDIAISGGLWALAVAGAGALSVDAMRR